MFRTGVIFVGAFIGLAFAGTDAQAALMLPELETDGPARTISSHASAAVPAESRDRDGPGIPLTPPERLAVFPAGSSTTAPTPGPTGTGGAAGVAILAVAPSIAEGGLAGYLPRQPSRRAPSPFHDGVFRPPRRLV